MKKTLTLILAIALSLMAILSLGSCNVFNKDSADGEQGGENQHTHTFADATCTLPKKCSCGATEGAARGHEWTTPDIDLCEVQSTCTRCGVTDGENKEHTPAEDDGDCSTEVKCSVCGDVTTPAGQHTPNADDGSCLTEITCSDCGTVTTPANDNHTGGTATCTEKAVCTVCSTAYGEIAPDNHIFADGVCACGLIDATEITADQLNAAVTKALKTGETDIEVILPADAPAEMLTAIRRAIRDTEGVADGSINLTLGGVTSIPDHSEFASEGSVIFGSVIQDENGESLEMPDEVLELNSINLPDVVTIGEEAFYFCGNLTSITAPKVQTIGLHALGYTALTSVEFPELTTIPNAMFSGTWTLTSAKFPKVTTIEQYGLLIGAGFAPEAFPLELTAEGDISIGTNAFNVTSQNYSGKVDLVLHSNKSGEVNGLTWKGYTFKSIEFLCTDGTTNHTYGAAVNNGDGTHTYTCTTCNLTKVERCHGEATCKELATCEECSVQFGELSDHILDPATGYCKFGCGNLVAVAKVTQGDNVTYYDSFSVIRENRQEGATVTLQQDVTNGYMEWYGCTFTLDLNGYTLSRGAYDLYANGAGKTVTLANTGTTRGNIGSVYIFSTGNVTFTVKGNADIGTIALNNSEATIDLSAADFTSCQLDVTNSGCNTSQFVLGNYAIYYANGGVVTGELTKGVTYIIKAAQ